jgi:hypothetical protein
MMRTKCNNPHKAFILNIFPPSTSIGTSWYTFNLPGHLYAHIPFVFCTAFEIGASAERTSVVVADPSSEAQMSSALIHIVQ